MSAAVVIPFAGERIDELAEQLRALDDQSPPFAGEVIVSCNAVLSADGVTELKAVVASLAVAVRVVDSSARRGPSAARNIGWRASQAGDILFCDADDVVDVHWVIEMRRALRRAALVGGRLDYDLLNEPKYAAWRMQSRTGLPVSHGLRYTPSANLGVSRALLVALEGFDEDLLVGEDMDLCARAAARGVLVAFVERAVIHYRLRTGMLATARHGYSYGRGEALLRSKLRVSGIKPANSLVSLREVAAILKSIVLSLLGKQHPSRAAFLFGAVTGQAVSSFSYREVPIRHADSAEGRSARLES